MPETANRGWLRWLGIAAVVVFADLATKEWITQSLQYGESREILPFFNLVLVHNSGAAFSFLAGAGGWQRWFFTAIAIVISAVIVGMLRKPGNAPLLNAALALVLGGAIGNLFDRVTLGHVVDFVQLHAAGHYFPAFNVADSAITVGVALLVWDGLRPARPSPAAVAAPLEKP
jgi:signal peptidase II